MNENRDNYVIVQSTIRMAHNLGKRLVAEGVEDQGSYKIVTLSLASNIVRAKLPEGRPVPSEQVWLVFPPKWTRLYADGRLLN